MGVGEFEIVGHTLGDIEDVGLMLHVGVMVGLRLQVGLALKVFVVLQVWVIVLVHDKVRVIVAVGVAVGLAVLVALIVFVRVLLNVLDGKNVGLGDIVGVSDGVFENVNVGVAARRPLHRNNKTSSAQLFTSILFAALGAHFCHLLVPVLLAPDGRGQGTRVRNTFAMGQGRL